MIEEIAREILAALDEDAARAMDERQLSDHLYSRFYLRPRPPEHTRISPQVFVDRLHRANAGHDRISDGWTIERLSDDGHVLAARGLARHWCNTGEFVHRGAGKPASVGDAISLFMPCDSTTINTYFYYALGSTPSDVADSTRITRYYFNARHEAAPTWLHFLTDHLTRYDVPYRLKCPVDSRNYTRADAMVLYIPRAYHAIVQLILSAHEHPAALAPELPLFTKRLAPGIALAEDPGLTLSFGQHRCTIFAQALRALWRENIDCSNAPSFIAADFARNGIDPQHPYLATSTSDIYAAHAQ